MKNSTLSVVVSVLFFLIVSVWLFQANMLPFSAPVTKVGGPGTFPVIILSIMVAGCGWISVSEYRKMRQGVDKQETDQASLKRVATLFLVATIYVLAVEYTGYIVATVLLLLISLTLFGVRNKRVLVAVALVFPVTLWVLFQRLLEVQLP